MVQHNNDDKPLPATFRGMPDPSFLALLSQVLARNGLDANVQTNSEAPFYAPQGQEYKSVLAINVINIHRVENLHMGTNPENKHGDNIRVGRDAIGSALGREAVSISRDINVFKEAVHRSSLQEDVKNAFIAASEEVAKMELSERSKKDVLDDLKKLEEEVASSDRDQSRMRRLWENIKAIAPTVAAGLSAAASIAKLISG